LEERPAGRERVEERREAARVAVCPEPIGAQRVDQHDEDVRAPGSPTSRKGEGERENEGGAEWRSGGHACEASSPGRARHARTRWRSGPGLLAGAREEAGWIFAAGHSRRARAVARRRPRRPEGEAGRRAFRDAAAGV